MAALAWDRTLETCVKRGWNALLLAGHAPYWRGPGGLRRGMIEAVSAEELEAMWREVMPGPERLSTIPGCRSVVLAYGDEFRFRTDVLGESAPKAIVLTHLGTDVPESFGQRGRLFEGWTAGEGSVNWWALYQWIVRGARGGCHPLSGRAAGSVDGARGDAVRRAAAPEVAGGCAAAGDGAG